MRELHRQNWKEFLANNTLDFDHLLTLVRIEMDLLQLEGKISHDWMILSLVLSEKLGDRLYAALSRAELYLSLSSQARQLFEKEIEQDRKEFKKIDKIFRTRNVLYTAEKYPNNSKADGFGELLAQFRRCEVVVLRNLEAVLNLKTKQITSASRLQKVLKALELLAVSAVTKDEFFRHIWNQQKFVPRLHDGIVRTFIYRIRKIYGIDIRIENGLIRARGMVILP